MQAEIKDFFESGNEKIDLILELKEGKTPVKSSRGNIKYCELIITNSNILLFAGKSLEQTCEFHNASITKEDIWLYDGGVIIEYEHRKGKYQVVITDNEISFKIGKSECKLNTDDFKYEFRK